MAVAVCGLKARIRLEKQSKREPPRLQARPQGESAAPPRAVGAQQQLQQWSRLLEHTATHFGSATGIGLEIRPSLEWAETPAPDFAKSVEASAAMRVALRPPPMLEDTAMAKGYSINTYRAIDDPVAFAAYAKLAGPAVQASGGRFLVRGNPVKTYEAGLNQRVVVVEFDSVEQAQAAYESHGYQEALRALGHGAERDIRIVEGL